MGHSASEPRIIWRDNGGPVKPPADHEAWRAALRTLSGGTLTVTLADRGEGAWFVALAQEVAGGGSSATPVDRTSDVVAALRRAGKAVTN
jgi:hypothetical protein